MANLKMHQTRSGRNYKPAYYCGVQQSSPWGRLSDVLTDVSAWHTSPTSKWVVANCSAVDTARPHGLL